MSLGSRGSWGGATILSYPQATPLDHRLARLAHFLRIDCHLGAMNEWPIASEPASTLRDRDHR